MEILLPEQTTANEIVFWSAELIGPESKKITRQKGDAILGHRQAGNIVCGSCG